MAAGSIPEKWIPFFSSDFRVIAPEQMGHGRTADLVDRPFHYHDMAEDTVELMRELEIESAAVVGYSDGGIIGSRHGDSSSRACDASLRSPGRTPASTATPPRTRSLLRSFDPEASPSPTTTRACLPTAQTTGPSFSARLQPMWSAEPSFTDEELKASRRRPCSSSATRDIVTPEHAVEMFRAIPRAQLCVVPNAGHGVMPKDAVLTFLHEEAADAE